MLAALNKLGLTDVNADNIAHYANAITKLQDSTKEETYIALEDFTKADAQAAVVAGNEAAAKAGDAASTVKAVREAKTQVALLSALAPFERVNSDWITQYENGINLLTLTAANDNEAGFKSIQTAINTANNTAINSADGALTGANRTKAKLQELVSLTNAYFTPDEKDVTAKADLIQKLNVDIAVINVNAAKTPAQLTSAVNALKQLDVAFELDMTEYKDANRAAYITYLGTAGQAATSIGDLSSKLIIVNAAEAASVFTKLNTAATSGTNAEILAAIKATGAKYVIDANEATYATLKTATAFGKASGAGDLGFANAANIAEVQTLVDGANLIALKAQAVGTDAEKTAFMDLIVKSGVYKDVSTSNKANYVTLQGSLAVNPTNAATVTSATATNQTAVIDAGNVAAVKAGTASGAQLLSKLNIIADVAKEVKAEYAAAYLASAKSGVANDEIFNATNKATLIQAVKDVNEAQVTAQGLKDLNNATTATELNGILVDLILDGAIADNNGYLNLSSADKLLAAELFLEDNTFDQASSTKLASHARSDYDTVKGEYTKLDAATPDGTEGVAKDLKEVVTKANAILTATTTVFGTGSTTVGSVTNSAVQAELANLKKLGYTAYEELTGAQKLRVAEEFIKAYPATEGKYEAGVYTSITALLNAVDAAIAAK